MNVRLTRWLYTDHTVTSDVILEDGEHFYGLEDLHDRPIPEGDYEIHITPSPRVAAGTLWSPDPPFLPLILPTPGRMGIRIHAGNTAADTQGCILLGMYYGQDRVVSSRLALEEFMKSLRLDASGLAKVHSLQIRRVSNSQGA